MVGKGGGMTAAERKHMDAVASLPCLICGATPVSLHHVRRYGETRKHSKVVPLCYTHHQGTEGIHTLGKREFERRYMTQNAMLAAVARSLQQKSIGQ